MLLLPAPTHSTSHGNRANGCVIYVHSDKSKWIGLLAEVGTKRLAGRSISSGCCFPVTFISHKTAFSVRWLRREFLKSFTPSNRLQVLFTGVPFSNRGRRRNHALKKLPVSCNYNNFACCRSKLVNGNRCLVLPLSPNCQHTVAPLLLLISLHVSPPAACPPINHSCVKPHYINPLSGI